MNSFVNRLILAISLLATMLETTTTDDNVKLFTQFFKSKENVFNSLMALINLSENDVNGICKNFVDYPNVHIQKYTPLPIRLAEETAVEEENSEQPIIPVHVCSLEIYHENDTVEEDEYFVTHIPKETGSLIFKLIAIGEDFNEIITTEITQSKEMHSPAATLEKQRSDTINYFKSDEYKDKAMKHLISELEELDMCYIVSPNYTLSEKLDDISIETNHEVIIFENHESVQIPLLPCPSDGNSNEIFYASFLTENAAVKVDVDSDGKYRMDYDLKWSIY